MSDKGAHFFRCDFQVHTPRDSRWKGRGATFEAERQAYAKELVAECRRIGLQAVAITDHHDLVFAPIIRRAAQDERDENGQPYPPCQRLVVFPGVELTLALARQALLILDADFPDDRLPQVLQAMAITAVDASQPTLPDVQPLDHIHSFAALHKKLDEHQWMQGRYIILPNVTDSGHKSVIRKGMHAEYKDMPCIGGYLDGSIDKLGTGAQAILAGDNPAWGSKCLAVFQTSDNRSRDFSALGRPSTWVKWAEPTAEALRQACLGQQSRIAHQAPQLPTVSISRLTVSNSKFLGPIDVAFNPQFNAVIGGRGTGKSTILDYLRWGLCDQTAQADDDELANPTVRRKRLIDNTLRTVDGQVEVFFIINDIPHVVRRHSSSGEILLKVGDDEFSKVREEHVRSLLPIHAYSQKQLSSVALRMDELTRFVTAPIQRALAGVDQRITEVSERLRENYAKVQRARNLDQAIAQQRLAERSLAEQATNLRNSLTDLTSDDRTILDAKPAYDAARETIREQDSGLSQYERTFTTLLSELDRATRELANPSNMPEELRPSVDRLLEVRRDLVARIRANVAGALAALQTAAAAGSEVYAAAAAVALALDSFDARYEEVKRRSTAHQTKLDELGQVEQRRREAAELLQQHERDRRGIGDPVAAHTALRSEIVNLYRERARLLEEECARITSSSSGLLRATVSLGQGLGEVEQKFRALIQGSNVRGSKIDQVFTALRVETDPLGTWEQVLAEVEGIMLLDMDAALTSESTPKLSRLGLALADQQRIKGRISPDGWLDLALTPVRDQPVFEYQTKEKEFIAFSAASAGQQATALLRILLSQAGMPLIVDQPEEDLDSQVVQDIVSQIWDAKEGRQLIFASHNANLVVNGDAELVITCDYRRAGDQSGGRISLQGAIDVPVVRQEITKVMEGGERAFRLRKEKYGF